MDKGAIIEALLKKTVTTSPAFFAFFLFKMWEGILCVKNDCRNLSLDGILRLKTEKNLGAPNNILFDTENTLNMKI